jgi:hypothetical protein
LILSFFLFSLVSFYFLFAILSLTLGVLTHIHNAQQQQQAGLQQLLVSKKNNKIISLSFLKNKNLFF